MGFPLASSWGILISTGMTLGTLMFLNVWLIIWPNQKIVIASATQVAQGGTALPAAATAAPKALLASRTNTLFSIPMLFFMAAARNLTVPTNENSNFLAAGITVAIIVGLLELNAIKGKLGPITKVGGVIHMGFVLTIVLYAVIEFFC
jgi:uncharacterized membrane protein